MIYTVKTQVSTSLKVKRSTFTALLTPLNATEDVSTFLKSLKKANPRARHICWAYRFQQNGIIAESGSDAGEPSGTAGLPILNALRSGDIVQSALFVIRIFGGIKLGKRGLIDAYGESAIKTILAGDIIPWEEKTVVHFKGLISRYGDYLRILRECNGSIIADNSDNELKWVMEIPLNKYNVFQGIIDERFESSVKVWREE